MPRSICAPHARIAFVVARLATDVRPGLRPAEGDLPVHVAEPVLTEANAATRVWAVQVASFGEEGNALKLRDRLRSDGYEAFISTVKQEGQVLSRVAVGPFLEESEAEALRGELSAALSLNARIVAFSN